MKTFIIVVLGMFVGGVLSLVVLWFGIKFLIRHFVKKLVTALEKLGGVQGVPPFRISLQKENSLEWKNPKAVEGITAALTGVGYMSAGEFEIREMPNAQLRALVNSQTNSYAVLVQINDMLVLDVVCYFEGNTQVLVTTAPESGLDRPDYSHRIRVDADLAADPAAAVTLHETMLDEQRGRATVPATAAAFPKVYLTAYAREMDWRIARGGVTPDEVRRSCAATGGDPPSDEAVEMVVQQWKCAISEFIDEQLRERFLKYVTKMSAAEWEDVRDRLYFVHEQSDRERVIEALAEQMEDSSVATAESEDDEIDDDDGEDSMDGDGVVYARIRPLFANAPVREAFLNAQTLLPEDRRYKRVASIKTPYPADVYVEPATANGEDD